jgi:peptidoglycan/xylan/chitin deacetylase (PgdA/CDA1 family)
VTHSDSGLNPMRRAWRPSALIKSSVVLHAGAAAGLVAAPAFWPWAAGAVVASHLALTGAGLWPRSRLLGPNLTRLPAGVDALAITIDDGPDPELTPKVLDLLDRYQARATFFCIGEAAARHPELVRETVRRGHAVENHSQRHRHHFSLQGPAALFKEISAAQDTFEALGVPRPRFFRAPAGLRNPFLEPVLCRLGLSLASWTRRGFDTASTDPVRVRRRLLRDLAAGDILLLHDGHAARIADGQPMILKVLPEVLQAAADAGLPCITLSAAFDCSASATDLANNADTI